MYLIDVPETFPAEGLQSLLSQHYKIWITVIVYRLISSYASDALFSGVRVHFSDIVLLYFIFHFGWYYLINIVDSFYFTTVFFFRSTLQLNQIEFDSVTMKSFSRICKFYKGLYRKQQNTFFFLKKIKTAKK